MNEYHQTRFFYVCDSCFAFAVCFCSLALLLFLVLVYILIELAAFIVAFHFVSLPILH